MNWIIIDKETTAAVVPGAGCFVKFIGYYVVYAPNVRIGTLPSGKPCLMAIPPTPITFPTSISASGNTTTQTTPWIGTAGDKLSASQRVVRRLKKKKKTPIVYGPKFRAA